MENALLNVDQASLVTRVFVRPVMLVVMFVQNINVLNAYPVGDHILVTAHNARIIVKRVPHMTAAMSVRLISI